MSVRRTAAIGALLLGLGGFGLAVVIAVQEFDADHPVSAGIDGEAVKLEPPLRFQIRPGVVRVQLEIELTWVTRSP